ncbi:unnamed protein product, partial [Owenia fusiformis]
MKFNLPFCSVCQLPSKMSEEVCKFAYDGQLGILKHKTEANSGLLTEKDKNGRVPLHWACSGSHSDVVEFLLNQNVPIDARDD